MVPEPKPDLAWGTNKLAPNLSGTLISPAWSAWLVWLFLLGPLFGVAQAPVPAEAVAEFKQAVDHFRAGSYPEALRVMAAVGATLPARG